MANLHPLFAHILLQCSGAATSQELGGERARLSPADRADLDKLPTGESAEDILARVAEAQVVFWDAMADLEKAIGREVESSEDFSNVTLETLKGR